MVLVTAGRLDVQRESPGLRKALQRVLRQPGLVLETHVCPGTAAEVDRDARERVVHRDNGVSVASDAATVAERAVEGLAECERGVLDGVMRSCLQITDRFQPPAEAA